MRNRAKCRKCDDIIESFHTNDYCACKCGEISVYGGMQKYECGASDWSNFIRVDDMGAEIIPKIKESNAEQSITIDEETKRPTREELIDGLEYVLKNLEELPAHAMSAPITHYDYSALLSVLIAVLRAD